MFRDEVLSRVRRARVIHLECLMIEIAMIVCLWNASERCKPETLTFEAESATPQQCILYGQMEMAKWAVEHPHWRVARFTCRPAGQVARL